MPVLFAKYTEPRMLQKKGVGWLSVQIENSIVATKFSHFYVTLCLDEPDVCVIW